MITKSPKITWTQGEILSFLHKSHEKSLLVHCNTPVGYPWRQNYSSNRWNFYNHRVIISSQTLILIIEKRTTTRCLVHIFINYKSNRLVLQVCRRGGYFCILLLFLPICCALKNPIETARISQYNINILWNTLKNVC